MQIAKLKFEDVKDDQQLIITKRELLEDCSEFATNAVEEFINQCGEMAEANWCSGQVEMLIKLFNAVLKGEPYAPEPEEE